jgi:hypothetical protein
MSRDDPGGLDYAEIKRADYLPRLVIELCGHLAERIATAECERIGDEEYAESLTVQSDSDKEDQWRDYRGEFRGHPSQE